MEGVNELQKIRMEFYGSDYIDVNNILKGSWGGYKEDYDRDSNGKVLHGVYYNLYSRYVPINDFGFFYNKFDCRKYDGIIKLPFYNFYLCERNGRYGLLDFDGNTLLHTAYIEILPYYWGWNPGYGMCFFSLFEHNISNKWDKKYRDNIFLIVTTETGKFTYNLITKTESKVYDDIFISGKNHPQIIYKYEDKYGVIDIEGNELLKPIYEYSNAIHSLYQNYNGSNWIIWLDKGLIYGKIPINLYDRCFRMGDLDKCFYIIERNKKFGLISVRNNIVINPIFDEIILYEHKGFNKYPYIEHRNIYNKYIVIIVFVITRKGNKYWLYNAYDGKCLLENCDNINYQRGKYDYSHELYLSFKKGEKKGFVLTNGEIIDNQEYDEITISKNCIYVSKNGKHGVFNIRGYAYVPCKYESIIAKGQNRFIVVNDGQEEIFDYSGSEQNNYSLNEPQTYSRYAGTYAQAEMGWSDDDIDTVLDGDPDAYWNID